MAKLWKMSNQFSHKMEYVKDLENVSFSGFTETSAFVYNIQAIVDYTDC
jgi:hypothetical protein